MVIQPRGQHRAPMLRSGHVNHTMAEDIPEGEEVLVVVSYYLEVLSSSCLTPEPRMTS
jgi:hypothetical protein